MNDLRLLIVTGSYDFQQKFVHKHEGYGEKCRENKKYYYITGKSPESLEDQQNPKECPPNVIGCQDKAEGCGGIQQSTLEVVLMYMRVPPSLRIFATEKPYLHSLCSKLGQPYPTQG